MGGIRCRPVQANELIHDMDVRIESNIDKIQGYSIGKKPSQKVAPAVDSVQFDQAAGLNRSLAATPEIRSEAVERAKKLIADSSYPPKETIWKVARILNDNINSTQE